MYFKDIADSELKHFHKTVYPNFSMSLTEILDSDLFKIENVLNGSIYRIYPLFYCKNIISNNPDDINLDNQCLICNKRETETYISFVGNDDASENIIIDDSLLDIYDIGDKLTESRFNSVVYRLRKQGANTGILDFEESEYIDGIFGDYHFKYDSDQLINNTGILINEKLKNNPLSVKLEEPYYESARYTLQFKVISLTGANVCEGDSTNFKHEDTISIELVENEYVSVPVMDYLNDSVLLYEVSVRITFDVPEIQNTDYRLTLSSNVDNISLGENITLTAKLSSEYNVNGISIVFMENSVIIGESQTNANGEATLEYTPSLIQNNIYSCAVFGVTANCNVNVEKMNSNIVFDESAIELRVSEFVEINGALYINEELAPNERVAIFYKGKIVKMVVTGEDGSFYLRFQVHNSDIGINSFKAAYPGSETTKSTSESISITVLAE